MKSFINYLNKILFHIEHSTKEYSMYVYKITETLIITIVILRLLSEITENLITLDYKNENFNFKYWALLVIKLLVKHQAVIYILTYFFLILCFFVILILLILLLVRIFSKANFIYIQFDKKRLFNLIHNLDGNSPALPLFINQLWEFFLDLMVLLAFLFLSNMFLGFGTIYCSRDYFIIVAVFCVGVLGTLLYILTRIVPKLFDKIPFDITHVSRTFSLWLNTILIVYCIIRTYPDTVLLFLITLMMILALLNFFGYLFKLIKEIKVFLFKFFKTINFLFGTSLATLNLFIVYFYLMYIFYFLVRVDNITNFLFMDTLYNYSYLIFIIINTIILYSWLNIEEEEVFYKIDCMVNILCFLLICLGLFFAVYLIFLYYMLICYNIVTFFLGSI